MKNFICFCLISFVFNTYAQSSKKMLGEANLKLIDQVSALTNENKELNLKLEKQRKELSDKIEALKEANAKLEKAKEQTTTERNKCYLDLSSTRNQLVMMSNSLVENKNPKVNNVSRNQLIKDLQTIIAPISVLPTDLQNTGFGVQGF